MKSLLFPPLPRTAGFIALALAWLVPPGPAQADTNAPPPSMDALWGRGTPTAGRDLQGRASVFRDGNYGLFIHWGLYSSLGGTWRGKTFYGVGEWIMNPKMAGIPVPEYQALARSFNPRRFDARAIARLAKDAGMKYVVITSKHHEGFAMFRSRHSFNIVDASPFRRDPMRELAVACREEGLGFGFYYSHYQDWTAPGGGGGPDHHPDGRPATFAEYFREKCYPQVEEICTQYGPLDIIWFDTPGPMPKENVVALHDLVRKTQPSAMLGSRIGHGMGDYESLGDMEVPAQRVEGLWETCDTTNDSWSYAWYDTHWKSPQEILRRLIGTVARGGTYLLNVGPDGQGEIPLLCQKYLRQAGRWLALHPEVVTKANPSPWPHAQPWGEATTTPEGLLSLVVFDWPSDGFLHLPGLSNSRLSAEWIRDGTPVPVAATRSSSGWCLQLPAISPQPLAELIRIQTAGQPRAAAGLALHPNYPNVLRADFATAQATEKKKVSWMEKFGEWKHAMQISAWKQGGRAVWDVQVLQPGNFLATVRVRGQGRPVWKVQGPVGFIQNQQAATSQYADLPIGILSLPKPGATRLEVSLVEGDGDTSSLESLSLTPVP